MKSCLMLIRIVLSLRTSNMRTLNTSSARYLRHGRVSVKEGGTIGN